MNEALTMYRTASDRRNWPEGFTRSDAAALMLRSAEGGCSLAMPDAAEELLSGRHLKRDEARAHALLRKCLSTAPAPDVVRAAEKLMAGGLYSLVYRELYARMRGRRPTRSTDELDTTGRARLLDILSEASRHLSSAEREAARALTLDD